MVATQPPLNLTYILYHITPQKSIWNTEIFCGDTTVNNICVSGILYEEVDVDLVKKAINNIIGTDKDGNDMELVDILDNDEIDPIDNIYNKMITKQILEYIDSNLPEREKDIMYYRYGLKGRNIKTQQEIADSMGISRSYVSRIETKVQNKIKNILKCTD